MGVLPEGQSLACPASGPPMRWIEEHGVTRGCAARKLIEIFGTRRSRVHSHRCCERYRAWIRDQADVPRLGGGRDVDADVVVVESPVEERVPEADIELFVEDGREVSVEPGGMPHDDCDYSPTTPPASPQVQDVDEEVPEGMADETAMDADGGPSDPSNDAKRSLDDDGVGLDLVRAFKKTRHCPACESGMSAPGIRHNAECTRSRAAVGEEYDRVVKARRTTDATAEELVQGLSYELTGDPHDS